MADPTISTLTAPQIDGALCERLVEAAAHSCPAVTIEAPAATLPPAAVASGDSLADSFAALSAAFTFGSIILAMLALIGAIAWGYAVKNWAEKIAKEEAAERVRIFMDQWLRNDAPVLIRKSVENLQDASLGTTSDADAADRMGEEAG